MMIPWMRLDPRAQAPTNAYGDDAGWDLVILEDTWVPVGGAVDVRTGLAVAIPPGHYGRIIGRSSALRRRNVLVVEGIIDCGFRGELFSYVYCPPGEWAVMRGGIQLEAGESVAQLIICQVPEVEWQLKDELPESRRGVKGFGSSGA